MSFLNHERVRTYPIILFTLSWVIYFIWIALGTGLTDKTGKPIGVDFICFYSASIILNDSAPEDVYDIGKLLEVESSTVEQGKIKFQSPWFYPPTYLLVIKNLSKIGYLPSLIVWTALTFAMFALSSFLILPNKISYLWFFTYPGIYQNATNGQNGFISAAIFTFSLIFIDKRPFLSGLLLGLITYKPHLALPAGCILLFASRFRALAGFLLTATLLALLSYAAFGAEPWIAFFRMLPMVDTFVTTNSLPLVRMNSVQAGLLLLGTPELWAKAVQVYISLAVLLATILLWRSENSLALRVSALLIATLIIAPFGYDYDLIILTPALILFGTEAWKAGWLPYEKGVMVAAWLNPVVASGLAEHTSILVTPFILFAFLAVVLHRHFHSAHSRAQENIGNFAPAAA